MNAGEVLRLYPPPATALPLAGLYLRQAIRPLAGPAGLPFIYANFIASLDGRISLADPSTGLHAVPVPIANPRDGALYLELAAQADVLLTTSRHLRALAAGRYHEVIELRANAPLAEWRRARHLPLQPSIAVVSAGLTIPLEALRERYRGPLLAITGAQAPPARVEGLRAAGVDVEQLPAGSALDGRAIAHALAARGHRTVYSVAGPRVTHALMAAGVLGRLYLTVAQLALGGRDFHSLLTGDLLDPPARFRLHQLHLDAEAPPGAGQILASFDVR